MKWLLVSLGLLACAPQPPAAPELPPSAVEGPSESVSALPPSGLDDPEPYNRDDWGRWIDVDGDCQDTRQEVLIAESKTAVKLNEKGCRVLSGRWEDPYTGEVFTDPSDLDIDHMVPLKAAYDAGGVFWNEDRKKAYFNDLEQPEHLIAVSASANRSKGSKVPYEWMPSNEAYHCQYIKDWISIKDRWTLDISHREALFLARELARSCK